MKDVNVFLAGTYEGCEVYYNRKIRCLAINSAVSLCKEDIASYTVIDETTKEEISVFDGIQGEMFFGDMGFPYGSGVKTKEYLISIEWKFGRKSLLCLDQDYYKKFVASQF